MTADPLSPRADEGATLCLTCGVQLLDKDHLQWCPDRVRRRDELAPENGANLLDEVVTALRKYVVFPSWEATYAVALWVAATHVMPDWQHATRLLITSPTKRCAKSRLLDVIAAMVARKLLAGHCTAAAIFRSIDTERPPSVLIDEGDSMFTRRNGQLSERAEDLRGLADAGFQRDRPMLRCVGPNQKPTPFPTFAMMAIAAIGADTIPDTIRDRGVHISLQRRAPGEPFQPFRHRRDNPALVTLGDRLGAWVAAHRDELADAEPTLPLEDRAADTWEPLIAFADLAGDTWPARARATALALTSDDSTEGEAAGLRLLADVQVVIADREAIATVDLLAGLNRLEESGWGSWNDGAGIKAHELAKHLRVFSVHRPAQLKIGGQNVRGYRREWLEDAWRRYLTARTGSESATSATSLTPQGIPGIQGTLPTPSADTPQPLRHNGSSGVADLNPDAGGNEPHDGDLGPIDEPPEPDPPRDPDLERAIDELRG
jgi:hypothetical protein